MHLRLLVWRGDGSGTGGLLRGRVRVLQMRLSMASGVVCLLIRRVLHHEDDFLAELDGSEAWSEVVRES